MGEGPLIQGGGSILPRMDGPRGPFIQGFVYPTTLAVLPSLILYGKLYSFCMENCIRGRDWVAVVRIIEVTAL